MKFEKYLPTQTANSNVSHLSPDRQLLHKSIDQLQSGNNSIFKRMSSNKLNQFDKLKTVIPHLSIKSKSAVWKARTSISTEACYPNCSQITKRLYSLVNSNISGNDLKHSISFANLPISNEIIDSESDEEKIHLKKTNKSFNDSLWAMDSLDINHNKLRGFLKQISAEKSGLPSKISMSIVNKSIGTKMKKSCNRNENPSDLEKEKEAQLTRNTPVSSTAESVEIDDSDVCKSDHLESNNGDSENNSDFNKYDEQDDKSNDRNFNRLIKNRNMNSSNCIEIHQEEFTRKNSGDSSTVSEEISVGKVAGKVNGISEITENVSQEHESKLSTDSFSKFNSYLNKFYKVKEKPKLKSTSQNKANNESFKICPSQKICLNTPNTQVKFNLGSGDKACNERHRLHSFTNCNSVVSNKKPEKKSHNPHVAGDGLQEEHVIHPHNVGENDPKLKITFSKKLFKIFTQSRQPNASKKSKLVRSSLETVTNIALDNIINLITILSVELILSTSRARNSSSIENLANKNGPNIKSARAVYTDDLQMKHKEAIRNLNQYKRFPKNQMNVLRSALHNSSNPSKNVALSFDFNGRVIRNQENGLNSQRLLCKHPHHGSLTSIQPSQLNNSVSKNSSTLSIPIPLGFDKRRFQSQKADLNSYDSNKKLYSQRSSKLGFNNDNQRSKERNMDKNTMEFKKLRNQQTYQFKLNCEATQNGERGDCRSSRNRTPFKSTTSLFRENTETSSRLFHYASPYKDAKSMSSEANVPRNINTNGNYKFSIQIHAKIDFVKLDEVFSLKDQLYNKCDKSEIYIRQESGSTNSQVNLANKRGNKCWFLYVESPTTEALKCSLRIVAKRFPEWNLQQYIDN